MAAAEYYNATAAAQSTPPQYSPYHQSPYQRPQELHGSPVPSPYSIAQGSPGPQRPHGTQQQYAPPPAYTPVQNQKPSVHFAPTSHPQSGPHSGPPSGPHSGRPSFSGQARPPPGQYLQPPPHHQPYAQSNYSNRPSQQYAQPPHMRPHMNGNNSDYGLHNGYTSDPEEKRRRRHRHRRRESREEEEAESTRDVPTRKNRSRSTNADSFLGAAGGGLIGDLIFPGLGTVGGAVAGWIGGRDYGKHRKHREDKLSREQKEWEHQFRDRSDSRERRHSDDRRSDHDRRPSYDRRPSDSKRHNSSY